MHPFQEIISSAPSELADQARQKLSPQEPEAMQALQVQALLFMLSRFPLDPEEVPRIEADIPRGIVRLSFLELSSPVPVLFEVPGHPVLQQLARAVQKNQTTDQFRAAKALRKWTSLHKLGRYHQWENACMDARRRALPWPTSQDYRNDRDEANRQMDRCGDEMRAHERKLRTSRQMRKQKIRELAGITASWFDITKELAMHLLNPGMANSNR